MNEGAEEAVVIGGSEVFEAFLPRCSRLYLTVVEGEFEGDAYFPMKLCEASRMGDHSRRILPG